MKVILNKCYGGFGLSHEAILRYHELKGDKIWFKESDFGKGTYNYSTADIDFDDVKHLNANLWSDYDVERTDPVLVQVVEELGDKANNGASQLVVVDIPDNIQWYIDEYDGIESLHEQHSSW